MKDFLSRSLRARIGLAIFLFFVLWAVIGPWLAKDIFHMDAGRIYFNALNSKPPSAQHWLGTNWNGNDVLAQLIGGAQGSVFVGLLSGAIATAAAIIVGVTAGFTGGFLDKVLNAFSNVVMTLPGFVLMIIITGFVSNPGTLLISFIIGILEWPYGARFLRAQTMSMRGRDFTLALRSTGEAKWRILIVEVVPHLTGIIAAMFLRAVVAGVFAQSGMAFLGISGSNVSWGFMIGQAQNFNAISQGWWWWYIPPGLCIALIGMATALVNFGIDEVSNPALRNASGRIRKITKKVLGQSAKEAL